MGWWARLQQAVGLLATMATLAVAAFTWVSIQQVSDQQAITREGQITDRYNTAVTNLGADSLDRRLGGIYALQRIMQDSSRDQPTVIQVLSAYIRTHAPQPKQGKHGPGRPADDVDAALVVLAHRDPQHDGHTMVNLAGAYLVGALLEGDLTHADLSHADLTGARVRATLHDAELTSAHLDHAQLWTDLTGAQMGGAYLTGADMVGTDLAGAHLASSGLVNADLTHADLSGADLTGADLTGAHLRGAGMSHAILTGTKR
ncbi:pentapeptide repeat-containing protein [Streptomyces sp. NPDC059101]|uniref:pentapeptide repeat-containing protein n=1 Tax=Streptomyces sp. NPDC059101 TaxID=3346728 RepID=UPI003677D1AA